MFQPTQILKVFRSTSPRAKLLRDEANKVIPKATPIKRGKSYVRTWKESDLPKIGELYGFLKPAKKKSVISVYTPKGGVLKTTISFNIARILALHNIKTLVIGLDVQASITQSLNVDNKEKIDEDTVVDSVIETLPKKTLYTSIIDQNSTLKDAILNTDLPSLDYIPEAGDLTFLEQRIRDEVERERFLNYQIEELKKDYDVIIFDNSPNWNFLIQNSLTAATDVISPISCEVNTYYALSQNLEIIKSFKDRMRLNWNNYIIVPTKKKNTRLSIDIEARYRRQFTDSITAGSIRDTTKGEEGNLFKRSIIETEPTSSLADDYVSIIKEIWNKINL